MTIRLFKRVLVANRGEIACRVIRACHDVGLEAVAVCSEADIGALHTELADHTVMIGKPPARDSYLCAERIIAAALSAGADAIHPGYGFLAESSEFAQAVRDSGLVWIGPDPQTIAEMGDKERAREIASRAGVPILPGSRGFGLNETEGMHATAANVGYPLLVKAAAGGGGIGMRLVTTPDSLQSTAATTQALCARLFGDASVYFERFVSRARHVEVQIFGDGAGGAVHMFERDCSVQRRYQKIVEESPAPGLSPSLRAKLLEAAVNLAKAQRYAGAGTVEFIVDVNTGEFFFLEMNTRIQVEHCVTEMVTGVDIVALQIRLANGESPSLRQEEIRTQGHAIECRLCAENPQSGFRPSSGRLSRVELAQPRDGVRIETGYREGDVVSVYYDSLLAKLIVWGSDREEAARRMSHVLDNSRIGGVATNLDFLGRILTHPHFLAGEVHTSFVEQHAQALDVTRPATAHRL